jgi:hypothetical protein
MKLLIISNVVSLVAGGVLGYLYGAHVYTQAEKVIRLAQSLESSAKARLKNLL